MKLVMQHDQGFWCATLSWFYSQWNNLWSV